MLIIHNSMQSASRQIYCNASEKKSHGQLGKMPGTWHLTNKWEALLSTNHPSNNISFFSEKKWTNNYLLQILWPFWLKFTLTISIHQSKIHSSYYCYKMKDRKGKIGEIRKKHAANQQACVRPDLSYNMAF